MNIDAIIQNQCAWIAYMQRTARTNQEWADACAANETAIAMHVMALEANPEPPANAIRQAAAKQSLTRLVCMSAGANDRVLIVHPDADLDDSFRAMCAETGELLTINGWLWSLDDSIETRAWLAREFWDWRA